MSRLQPTLARLFDDDSAAEGEEPSLSPKRPKTRQIGRSQDVKELSRVIMAQQSSLEQVATAANTAANAAAQAINMMLAMDTSLHAQSSHATVQMHTVGPIQ